MSYLSPAERFLFICHKQTDQCSKEIDLKRRHFVTGNNGVVCFLFALQDKVFNVIKLITHWQYVSMIKSHLNGNIFISASCKGHQLKRDVHANKD